MGIREVPAIPAKTVYICDAGCGEEIKRHDIEVKAEVAERDYTGGIVYGHKWIVCQRCASDLRKWLRERGGRL